MMGMHRFLVQNISIRLSVSTKLRLEEPLDQTLRPMLGLLPQLETYLPLSLNLKHEDIKLEGFIQCCWGRCEHCKGDGNLKIEMNFLPDVYVTCDVCKGKRFNKETLQVYYKGKNIYDVLDMTVSEASDFFGAIPSISRKIKTLESVGLGYIKLGQSALTLSGGEAQRVKLSLELAKRSTGKTLYILDEPTTACTSPT